MIKGLRNFFVVLALMAVSVLVGFKVGREKGLGIKRGSGDWLNLELISKVRQKLDVSFLEKDKIDEEKMSYGAIEGMVSSLDDPYTVFLPPKENKDSNEDLAGEFGGVGIQLGYKNNVLAVIAPLAKTPAEKAGIEAGDLITKIIDRNNNVDKDTSGISLEEAMNLIRGKIGTEVSLVLYREGKKDTFTVSLIRDNIVVQSTELEWKEEGGYKVAWIKLYKFSEQTYKDWPEIVKKINEEKNRLGNKYGGIVLDLRNNPGGYLQASVLVASDLLKEGVVVIQQSADGKKEEYGVDKKMGNLVDDKLVVLINGGSASAAEILAGALRGHSRAKLVGEKSFGKGTVQEPIDFIDGSGLHVTVAKWLLPDGKNIHGEGVEPDVVEKLTTDEEGQIDNQFEKAVEVLLEN